MKIVSTAPCRLSLIGGGTDIEPFSTTYGGAVISMAINIRQKFTLTNGDDQWMVRNEVPYGCLLDFVYAFRKRFGVNSMHHNTFKSESDGGIRGGIGSSAAISVAIVGALAKSQNKVMSRQEIAELAWDIETRDLAMFGGKQDQYAAAFGGLNLFKFSNKVSVHSFDRKYVEAIMPFMVLFHTNLERQNTKIQEGFKKLDRVQIKSLQEIKSLVMPTVRAIGDSDIQALGRILDTAWKLKKNSNKGVSNRSIDAIYDKAKKLGAIGGKLCGSGGGGFMFFVTRDREKLIRGLNCRWWDFSVCANGVETRIV